MSIEVVETQIDLFLRSDKPEVLAIKGAWGVGKTYSWNKFLQKANSENNIALKKYSYVSLFGINSLEAFKYSIFEHVINREMIGTEASIETFKENTTGLFEAVGRKSIGLFKGTSLLKGFTPAIESLSFLSLNGSLICIDDLERRGSSLSMKDVLGLVTQLKEQKQCKVVLLLNDKEEGLEDYKKYREKVIDTELQFSPTAKECAEIAFDIDNPDTKRLLDFSQELDIKNIRVLKKIERLINLAQPLTKGYEPEISHQVAHSLVLYSWCYCCTNDGAPSLDFVTNLGFSFWGIGEDKEESDEIKKWKTTINKYGYLQTDELDLVLAESVKTGYFVEKDFKEKAEKKNDEILATKSEGSFSEAWRLYHDSFDNNADDVVNGLYDSFKKNAKHISLTNLNGTVMLFKELGHEKKASEIIDLYIIERKEEKDLFNLKENNFFGDVRDPEIVEKFDSIYASSITTESAMEVLDRISGEDGWSQKDEIVLANTSADEYYKLFKSKKGRDLSAYVSACLQFGRFSNTNDQQKQIVERVVTALRRIASESEINRRRLRKYGIELDNA